MAKVRILNQVYGKEGQEYTRSDETEVRIIEDVPVTIRTRVQKPINGVYEDVKDLKNTYFNIGEEFRYVLKVTSDLKDVVLKNLQIVNAVPQILEFNSKDITGKIFKWGYDKGKDVSLLIEYIEHDDVKQFYKVFIDIKEDVPENQILELYIPVKVSERNTKPPVFDPSEISEETYTQV